MELKYNHESSTGSVSPPNLHSSSDASFPIIAVAIIGIFATIFLLVFYYMIFVIKCCLHWHRIDIFSSLSSLNHHSRNPHPPPSPSPSPSPHPSVNNRGLHESVIRSIPIFQFQKHKDDTGECAVCLAEFQLHEKLRIIPNCAHVFHIDCIDVWLQNNPNCPLCRNSISISLQTHFPVPPPTLDLEEEEEEEEEEDYVFIEFDETDVGVGERRNINNRPNSIAIISPCSPRKKMARKKHGGNLSSMGDEWIDVASRRKGDDDQFSVQPIRRSCSMDSVSDRHLYLAVQQIIQRNTITMDNNNVDVIQGNDASTTSSSSSSSTLRRGFFSFGHARSAVLPLHVKP